MIICCFLHAFIIVNSKNQHPEHGTADDVYLFV